MTDDDSNKPNWFERSWNSDINKLCSDPFEKAKKYISIYNEKGVQFGMDGGGVVVRSSSFNTPIDVSDIDADDGFLDAKVEIVRYLTHLKVVKFLDLIYGAIDLKLKTANKKAVSFFLKRYEPEIDLIEEDINKTYSTLIDSRRSHVYHVSFLEIKKRGFDLFSLIAVGLTSIEAELQMYDNI